MNKPDIFGTRIDTEVYEDEGVSMSIVVKTMIIVGLFVCGLVGIGLMIV